MMILGVMALTFSGCADSEIDDAQGTSLDDTAATDPAQVAAQAITVTPAHGPLPFDPCPCDQPICRPGCTKTVIVAPAPLPREQCPCADPVCRPVCKNP